jgi:hypothetical protein
VTCVTTISSTAHRVENSTWFDHTVRVGLVAYGIVHLLVGWLAFQLATGDPSGPASQQGALHQVAQESYGPALLVVIGIGFLALTIWKGLTAVYGHRRDEGAKRAWKRLMSAGKGVIYLVLAVSAAQIALGSGSSSSGTDEFTAKVMKAPGGQLLVGAIGLGIIAGGVWLAVKGLTRRFEDNLESGATSGSSGSAIVRLGQVGYVAKGAAFAAVGFLFAWAAWTFDPDKAGGLDSALHTLLDESYGPALIGAIGAGLIAFGLYSFAWAWYADTST